MLFLRRENIELIKGDTLIFYIEVVTADDEICADLSDWTATMTVKEKVIDTNPNAIITVNNYAHPDADEENGLVYFKLSSADTSLLQEKKYFYDIQFEKVIDGEEQSYTVMIGDILPVAQITIS